MKTVLQLSSQQIEATVCEQQSSTAMQSYYIVYLCKCKFTLSCTVMQLKLQPCAPSVPALWSSTMRSPLSVLPLQSCIRTPSSPSKYYGEHCWYVCPALFSDAYFPKKVCIGLHW